VLDRSWLVLDEVALFDNIGQLLQARPETQIGDEISTIDAVPRRTHRSRADKPLLDKAFDSGKARRNAAELGFHCTREALLRESVQRTRERIRDNQTVTEKKVPPCGCVEARGVRPSKDSNVAIADEAVVTHQRPQFALPVTRDVRLRLAVMTHEGPVVHETPAEGRLCTMDSKLPGYLSALTIGSLLILCSGRSREFDAPLHFDSHTEGEVLARIRPASVRPMHWPPPVVLHDLNLEALAALIKSLVVPNRSAARWRRSATLRREASDRLGHAGQRSADAVRLLHVRQVVKASAGRVRILVRMPKRSCARFRPTARTVVHLAIGALMLVAVSVFVLGSIPKRDLVRMDERGIAAFKAGHYQAAATDFRAVQRRVSYASRARYQLGCALWGLHRRSAAAISFVKAIGRGFVFSRAGSCERAGDPRRYFIQAPVGLATVILFPRPSRDPLEASAWSVLDAPLPSKDSDKADDDRRFVAAACLSWRHDYPSLGALYLDNLSPGVSSRLTRWLIRCLTPSADRWIRCPSERSSLRSCSYSDEVASARRLDMASVT
jgi:hypothetical protein